MFGRGRDENSLRRRQSGEFSTKDRMQSFLRRRKGLVVSSFSMLFADYTAKNMAWILCENFSFLQARKGGTQHPPVSPSTKLFCTETNSVVMER